MKSFSCYSSCLSNQYDPSIKYHGFRMHGTVFYIYAIVESKTAETEGI